MSTFEASSPPGTRPIRDLNIVPKQMKKAAMRAPALAPKIRIVVAYDHRLVREGISSMLSLEPDFQVVGEGSDACDAIRLVTELKPDVLLLDYPESGSSGVDVARELNARKLRVRTILLAASIPKSALIAALQTGVRGIVLKDSPPDLLIKSIRKVHEGQVWTGRDVTADILEALANYHLESTPEACRGVSLTMREREILRLVVDGESNKGIAKTLDIRPDTVKHHLTSIFDKTGASSRLELALFAIHHHLVDSPTER